MTYAELHCLSNFSFLRGASHPEELVGRAVELGYSALAITDECSVAGVVRAHRAARGTKLKLIIGSQFTLSCGLKLVLLAVNRNGYGRLSRLITHARRHSEKGEYRLARVDIENRPCHDCIALWLPAPGDDPEAGRWLKQQFDDRAWLAVELHRGGRDERILESARQLADAAGMPLTAAGDVHMHVRARRSLQDTLTAIRLGRPLNELGGALFPNGERHLRDFEQLAQVYPADLLEESTRIASLIDFSLDELRYQYPHELVPEGYTPIDWLRELTYKGAHSCYPEGVPEKVHASIEHELELIAELQYEAFFLTVHDLVWYARNRGILCQGRGSAANSTVCYCLGVTAVDPSRMSLLFERFVSRERDEPPDIDVDFEHERREEVIQYIYERYGDDHAAIAATVITYRMRSAVRDVGKALGLSLDQIDTLSGRLHHWDGPDDFAGHVEVAGFDGRGEVFKQLRVLVEQIHGFPRHLSQHTGGFVISHERLDELVPIENAAMDARTVIQWDKDDLESLGLIKVDVLALGMLTAIRKCFEQVRLYKGERLTLDGIPEGDKATYAMIQKADTVGVFQIESRAQMSMLPRLKPANFYDLVIEVAIVRPGPIQGDMVHPYLARRKGIETVEYPSEELKRVLERTLGVPIFQEQVMQIAIVAAGYSPGEADELRRSMAAWKRKGGLEPHEQRLKAGFKQNGYTDEFADRIFNQIRGFGEYGFPESHSASFALLAYVSAWLKCHEPAAFTCALLNSQPMGFYAPAQLINDARRHDVQVRPIDIRYSDWDHTLEPVGDDVQPALRLGMRLVHGLKQAVAGRIVEERRRGSYKGIDEVAARCELNGSDLEALAAADALHGFQGQRHQAHWQVAGLEPSLPVFGRPHFDEAAPLLNSMSPVEEVAEDYRTAGVSLKNHPLALIRGELDRMRVTRAVDLQQGRSGSVVRAAGLVTHRQRPGTATGVVFSTLEDETGLINLIIRSDTVEAQGEVFLYSNLLLVTGVLQHEDNVIHIMAGRIEDITSLLEDIHQTSRDFQ